LASLSLTLLRFRFQLIYEKEGVRVRSSSGMHIHTHVPTVEPPAAVGDHLQQYTISNGIGKQSAETAALGSKEHKIDTGILDRKPIGLEVSGESSEGTGGDHINTSLEPAEEAFASISAAEYVSKTYLPSTSSPTAAAAAAGLTAALSTATVAVANTSTRPSAVVVSGVDTPPSPPRALGRRRSSLLHYASSSPTAAASPTVSSPKKSLRNATPFDDEKSPLFSSSLSPTTKLSSSKKTDGNVPYTDDNPIEASSPQAAHHQRLNAEEAVEGEGDAAIVKDRKRPQKRASFSDDLRFQTHSNDDAAPNNLSSSLSGAADTTEHWDDSGDQTVDGSSSAQHGCAEGLPVKHGGDHKEEEGGDDEDDIFADLPVVSTSPGSCRSGSPYREDISREERSEEDSEEDELSSVANIDSSAELAVGLVDYVLLIGKPNNHC
jgi:hypothetical protein